MMRKNTPRVISPQTHRCANSHPAPLAGLNSLLLPACAEGFRYRKAPGKLWAVGNRRRQPLGWPGDRGGTSEEQFSGLKVHGQPRGMVSHFWLLPFSR